VINSGLRIEIRAQKLNLGVRKGLHLYSGNEMTIYRIKHYLRIWWILCLLALLLGCVNTTSGVIHTTPDFSITAEPWPQADKLFRSDPHWLGSDDAYSIDLGHERVLWLFGDTFINPDGGGNRKNATLTRNSVAIQRGYNPSLASIKFYWSTGRDGKPESFFRGSEDIWFWPGGGICIDKKLVIFLMKIRHSNKGFRFDVTGWTAVMIENSHATPSEWTIRRLGTPKNRFNVIIGSASVIYRDDFVFAFGADSKTHHVYVVRWPISSFLDGDLMTPQWWTGTSDGWIEEPLLDKKPAPLFSKGQMEFTVHYSPLLKLFLQVQTGSFQDPSMAFRAATDIKGPWSLLQNFYKPMEAGQSNLIIYAGKSHPELTGADIVFTYAVNSTDFGQLLRDHRIYYPAFLKGHFTNTAIIK